MKPDYLKDEYSVGSTGGSFMSSVRETQIGFWFDVQSETMSILETYHFVLIM